MTQEQAALFQAAFMRWFQGNAAATMLCLDLLEIVHVWDDLIDKDKPVSDGQIDAAFRKLMLDLPMNPFWQAHSGMLIPALQSSWLQWHAANVMERELRPGDKEKAYMLRAAVYQVFHLCAALCGGFEWAKSVGPEIYRLYGETAESYQHA
jgi:hypothetical protein